MTEHLTDQRFIAYANTHLGILGVWRGVSADDRGINDLLPPECLATVMCDVPVSSREIKVVDQIFALGLLKDGAGAGVTPGTDTHHVALIQVRRHGVDQFVCVGSANGEGARTTFLSLVTQGGEFARFRRVASWLQRLASEVFPSQEFDGSLLTPDVVRAHNNWFDLIITRMQDARPRGNQSEVYVVRLEVTRTNIFGGETLCRDGDPAKPLLVSRFELEATSRDLTECRDQLIEKLALLRLHGITSELLRDQNRNPRSLVSARVVHTETTCEPHTDEKSQNDPIEGG